MRPPRSTAPSRMRKFAHITLPLMANLYLVCMLLDMVFALGDFNSTFFVSGGGPAMSTEVLATLGIRYAFTVALPRLGRGHRDVGAAGADPAGHHPDAAGCVRRRASYERDHRTCRRIRSPAVLPAAPLRGGSRRALPSASLIAVWSITPIYNMWKIALDSHDGIFGGSIWPEDPTLESFRVVVTQDFWYLAAASGTSSATASSSACR